MGVSGGKKTHRWSKKNDNKGGGGAGELVGLDEEENQKTYRGRPSDHSKRSFSEFLILG